jgi:hypothetical protein
MSQQMREIHLDSRGLSYVRECLSAGKELSRHLLTRLELEPGTVSTFLPVQVSKADVYKFETGGKVTSAETEPAVSLGGEHRIARILNMNEVLAEIVQTHLKSAIDSFCLIEDEIAAPGDLSLRNAQATVLTCNQSVYYQIKRPQADLNVIESVLRKASSISPPTVGSLGQCRLQTDSHEKDGQLGVKQLIEFAEHTEKVFVGAYDGEGFLIWSKVR